jgi:hypothetical protein
MHEEGLEPTHLAVPEPKGHIEEHDAAGSVDRAVRDAGGDTSVHEGPGERGGWAAGQGWTGGDPVQPAAAVSVPDATIRALRALIEVLLDALKAGEIEAVRTTAQTIRLLLGRAHECPVDGPARS